MRNGVDVSGFQEALSAIPPSCIEACAPAPILNHEGVKNPGFPRQSWNLELCEPFPQGLE
jgi:hypothetical protein